MRVLDALLNTIENELSNRRDWEFDTRIVENIRREGNTLTLNMGRDAEITIRFQANGSDQKCYTCRQAKGGWPHWWANVASKDLSYACHDCVADRCRNEGNPQASGPA